MHTHSHVSPAVERFTAVLYPLVVVSLHLGAIHVIFLTATPCFCTAATAAAAAGARGAGAQLRGPGGAVPAAQLRRAAGHGYVGHQHEPAGPLLARCLLLEAMFRFLYATRISVCGKLH